MTAARLGQQAEMDHVWGFLLYVQIKDPRERNRRLRDPFLPTNLPGKPNPQSLEAFPGSLAAGNTETQQVNFQCGGTGEQRVAAPLGNLTGPERHPRAICPLLFFLLV